MMPVVVSNALPMDPSTREWARHYVRHGMADILAWLGEEVGPEPDAQTHAVSAGGVLYVSAEWSARLVEASTTNISGGGA